MKRALRNFFIAAAGLALIAACGGGGSDSDGGLTGGAPPSEPATITTENAPLIAGTVAEVAMGQGIFSSIFTTDLPIGSIGADAAVSPVMKPVFSAAMKTASPSQLYATSAGRENCAVSGTVDIQVTISDPTGPSVNDEFIFDFTNCDDGSGVVVDGGMTITIITLEGDMASGNFLLGMQIDLSAFAVTEGGETTAANGTITIDIDTSMPPVTTISVSAIAFVTTSEGAEDVLTNFSIDITEDASTFPAAVTVETSFTISSPRIGGEVTVTTSLALQSMGEDYPFVGELRIEGAGGAVIIMVALDANTVRLIIDVDGDGADDDSMDMTWEELMAAAA
ncbi:MAG: hypothetical protein GWP60_09270 [Gammaproteobacteria bacterium]|jgi:hypothetical protein|nr:hypothetical protein [Gammaproteobacteria bacterium]